uniref:Non-specific lipid-transfer protein n=1 Tax=Cicer arietinum TaxID=3827 RepID=A0A1S3DWD0_CICAR|nr:non-specific lipid-transfer protein 1-like [Cicer arietinum]
MLKTIFVNFKFLTMKPSTSFVGGSSRATLLVILVFVSSCEAYLTCGNVITYLGPCLNYIAGNEKTLPGSCCEAAKGVLSAVTSKLDKMVACECVKRIAYHLYAKPENAKDIPNKCAIQFPYDISPYYDCSTVE